MDFSLVMTEKEREEAMLRIDNIKIMNYQTLASASGSQYPEFFSEWIEPIATDTELTIKKWNHNTIYPIRCKVWNKDKNQYIMVGSLTYVPPSLRKEFSDINSWDNLHASDFAKIFSELS
jgi:hypothetical protein